MCLQPSCKLTGGTRQVYPPPHLSQDVLMIQSNFRAGKKMKAKAFYVAKVQFTTHNDKFKTWLVRPYLANMRRYGEICIDT